MSGKPKLDRDSQSKITVSFPETYADDLLAYEVTSFRKNIFAIKISPTWLRDFVDYKVDVRQLRLTSRRPASPWNPSSGQGDDAVFEMTSPPIGRTP